MSPDYDIDLNEALRATLDLFADLYREGLTGPAGERARKLTEFLDVLPQEAEEELQSRHQDLFGFNIFPLGSVFLEKLPSQQSQMLDFIVEIRKEAGFPVHGTSESLDHISVALSFLASCDDEIVLSRFIDSHLLGWLPILNCAIQEHGDTFYSRMSHLALMLICEMRKSMKTPPSLPAVLPEREPCILDGDQNGIREIADFLVTPVRSGIFLSRRSIRQLGNEMKMVSGFGNRSSMMQHALEGAAMYREFSHLLNEIRQHVSRQRLAWNEAGACAVAAGMWAKGWGSVLDGTDEMLNGLGEASL